MAARKAMVAFILVCLMVAGLPVAHAQAGHSDDDENVVQLLGWLNSADPAADVQAAIAKKDYRFIGVMGYTTEVPGLSDRELQRKYGVRVLEGTHDYSRSEAEERLQRLAGSMHLGTTN